MAAITSSGHLEDRNKVVDMVRTASVTRKGMELRNREEIRTADLRKAAILMQL
jgi:hypothetical protein